MSTFSKTQLLLHGVRCDKCGEEVTREPDPTRYEWDSARDFYAWTTRLGWTYWGGRKLRTYCPTCQPSRNHKMYALTDSYAKGGRSNDECP